MRELLIWFFVALILAFEGCNTNRGREVKEVSKEDNYYHVFFSRPVSGYDVEIDLHKEKDWDGYKVAKIHCNGKGHEFSAPDSVFTHFSLPTEFDSLLAKDGRIVIDYPVFKERYNNLQEDFYFMDADFDGDLEFLLRHDRDLYYVYEIVDNNLLLKDYGPFGWFNCFTKIDSVNKQITLYEHMGGGYYSTAQFSKANVRFTGDETPPEGNGNYPVEAILRDYLKGSESDFRLDWIKSYNPDDDITTQHWP